MQGPGVGVGGPLNVSGRKEAVQPVIHDVPKSQPSRLDLEMNPSTSLEKDTQHRYTVRTEYKHELVRHIVESNEHVVTIDELQVSIRSWSVRVENT